MGKASSGQPLSLRLRRPVEEAIRRLARQARQPAAQVINEAWGRYILPLGIIKK